MTLYVAASRNSFRRSGVRGSPPVLLAQRLLAYSLCVPPGKMTNRTRSRAGRPQNSACWSREGFPVPAPNARSERDQYPQAPFQSPAQPLDFVPGHYRCVGHAKDADEGDEGFEERNLYGIAIDGLDPLEHFRCSSPKLVRPLYSKSGLLREPTAGSSNRESEYTTSSALISPALWNCTLLRR